MKDYFRGYNLGNDRELSVVSKESNRIILDALKEAYPSGLNATELSEKTGLPLKTIYASLKELNTELFINELGKPRKSPGRPLTKGLQSIGGERSAKFVMEDRSRIMTSMLLILGVIILLFQEIQSTLKNSYNFGMN